MPPTLHLFPSCKKKSWIMWSVQQHITHINCNYTAFPLFLNSTSSTFSATPGKQVPPYLPTPRRGGVANAHLHCAPISFSHSSKFIKTKWKFVVTKLKYWQWIKKKPWWLKYCTRKYVTPRVLAMLVPRAGPVMEHALCLHSPFTKKSLINKHGIQRKENITALTGVVSLNFSNRNF
jgi:hypothetical protein